MLIELSYSGVNEGEVTNIGNLYSFAGVMTKPVQVGFVTGGAYHLVLMTVNVDV